jgi:hypothetical protein
MSDWVRPVFGAVIVGVMIWHIFRLARAEAKARAEKPKRVQVVDQLLLLAAGVIVGAVVLGVAFWAAQKDPGENGQEAVFLIAFVPVALLCWWAFNRLSTKLSKRRGSTNP